MASPPTYIKGIGALGLGRYTAQRHFDGTEFRHTADQIDMNPPVISSAATVQASFQDIAAFIAAQANNGEGLITVGDGYDCWHNANGQTNFDETTPSLDTLLNPAFQSIIAFQTSVYAGSGSPPAVLPGFTRLQFGGILSIKAGTYIVKKSIQVPPGITIIGEGYGTKIINASNLNLTVLPPIPKVAFTVTNATNASPIEITVSPPIVGLVTGDVVNVEGITGNTAANSNGNPTLANQPFHSPWTVTVIDSTHFTLNGSTGNGGYAGGGTVTTSQPVFTILTDPNRAINDGAIDASANYFGFERETRIMNLLIADNFVEPTVLGDSFYYKQPQNATTSTGGSPPGLIQQELGSSLVLDGVSLIGRAAASSWTGSGIFLDTSISPVTSGTLLSIDNCTLDGFSLPIIWCSTAGGNDYCEITNTKIRGYGNYNGDSSDAISNSLILVNDSTTVINNNILYGAGINVIAGIFINGVIASLPAKQARGKLTVTANDFMVDKASNSSNSTFSPIATSGLIISGTYLSYLIYGNNFQDTFDLSINGTAALSASSTNVTFAEAAIFNNATTFNNTATFATISSSILVESLGNITFGSEGFLLCNSGSIIGFTSGSTVSFTTGSLLTLNGYLNGTLNWEATATSPALTQVGISTGTAQNLLIQPQGTSQAGHAGGNLLLASGNNGFPSTTPSNIILQPANSGGALSIYPCLGTVNTQAQLNSVYMSVVSTGASGSNKVVANINVPSTSSTFVEICWSRRDPTTIINPVGNKAAVMVLCNSSGTVTINCPLTVYVPGGGAYFDPISGIGAITDLITLTAAGANFFHINAIAQSAAFDWQFTINCNVC